MYSQMFEVGIQLEKLKVNSAEEQGDFLPVNLLNVASLTKLSTADARLSLFSPAGKSRSL